MADEDVVPALLRLFTPPNLRKSLVRIIIPLPLPASPAPDVGFAHQEGVCQEDRAERRRQEAGAELCRRVHGVTASVGACVAWQHAADAVQVVCHKGCVVHVFAKLFHSQKILGVKIGELKAHVVVKELDEHELHAACSKAVCVQLQAAGWARLGDSSFLWQSVRLEGSGTQEGVPFFLRAEPGRHHDAVHASIHVEVHLPSTLLLSVEAHAASFSPVARLSAGAHCTVLPHLERASIQRVLPSVPAHNEAAIRSNWLFCQGYQLPTPIPCFYELASAGEDDDDDDDAGAGSGVVVPSSCVWSSGGLTPGPARERSQLAAVQQITHDLTTSAFNFFGGPGITAVAAAAAAAPTGTPAARTPAAPPLMSTTAGFVSAKQLSATGSALINLTPTTALRTAGCGLTAGAGTGGPGVEASGSVPQLVQRKRADASAERSKWEQLAGRLPAEVEEDGAGTSATRAPMSLPPSRPLAKAATVQLAKAASKPAMTAGSSAPAAAGAHPALAPGTKPALGGKRKPSAGPLSKAKPATGPKAKPAAGPKAAKPAKAPALPAPSANSAAGGCGALPAAHNSQGAATGQSQAIATPALQAAAPDTKQPPRKRAKAGDMDVAAVAAKVLAAHRTGSLKSLSIPEMQCYLRTLPGKQPTGGKKADLEARLSALLAASDPTPAAPCLTAASVV
ncbi:hypothetical protein FOA52_011216 [Chlamydomonas sp. UWO 241]|nr:hypothetical protein FOA52_011216 [Chlamydomonas sp. UWO 241]